MVPIFPIPYTNSYFLCTGALCVSLLLLVSLQLKILHTRVFGQFAIICTLLGVMGLKDMMDRNGKFVTDSEVEERVREMEKTRNELLDRLEYQAKQQRVEQQRLSSRHSQ